MEVLETGRPPNALERSARALLRRRGVRAGLAVGALLLLAGGWVVHATDDSPPSATAEAEETGAMITGSPGLRPAPAYGRRGVESTWKVAPDVSVRSGPRGHTVTFFAVNRGPEAQDPHELRVGAAFVDRPRLEYQAACAGVEPAASGYRPLRGKVPAGERVLVRCTDTTEYDGAPARIDPASVVVRTTPCEDAGRSPGV